MRSDLQLTGSLDRDLQLVHDRGALPTEVDALLRRYQGWVARLARSRWRRSRRAHGVVEVQDVEQLVRIGVLKCLRDFVYLCSAGCQRRGAAWAAPTRAEWEAHLARRHAGAPVPPKNDVGHHVRIGAVNEVNAECRRYYKLKRVAPRYADEVVPVEVVDHLRRRVQPRRGDPEDHADESVAPDVDLALQLGELAAEADEHLYPAARRVLGHLLAGETAAEAAQSLGGQPGDAAAARRAENFLKAWGEKTWSRA